MGEGEAGRAGENSGSIWGDRGDGRWMGMRLIYMNF